MKKRIGSILLMICILAGIFGIHGVPAGAAGKIRLSQVSAAMRVGQKKRLTLRNMPKNGTVTWTSSAKNIASVSKQGLVTAKKRGTATIRTAAL